MLLFIPNLEIPRMFILSIGRYRSHYSLTVINTSTFSSAGAPTVHHTSYVAKSSKNWSVIFHTRWVSRHAVYTVSLGHAGRPSQGYRDEKNEKYDNSVFGTLGKVRQSPQGCTDHGIGSPGQPLAGFSIRLSSTVLAFVSMNPVTGRSAAASSSLCSNANKSSSSKRKQQQQQQ